MRLSDTDKKKNKIVAHIKTVAFQGVDALPVDVQVHLAPGQNAFNVVGLPDAQGQKLLTRIIDEGQMTARGFNRVLRVARTLADIKGTKRPDMADMATALQWRGVQMS